MTSDGSSSAWIPEALTKALGRVTIEEFRVADFRFDRDLRLGRQVLFLLSSTEWTRRTTELIEISRVRSVDTEVVVDVDLAYAVHSGLRPDGDQIWLPLFTVPTTLVRSSPVSGERRAGRRAGRQHESTLPDPMTSLEVTDATGARVPKAPQSEVQHWIAAALAELLVKRLPRDPTDAAAATGRDELLLLAAAIRGMLVNPVAMDRVSLARDRNAAPVRAGERIGAARTALLHAIRSDLERARPALHSRLGDMIAAVYGTTFVVVGAERSGGPTSYSVRMPARRLHRIRTSRRWQTPRAQLRIDLLTASANTDRLIRLTLPEGVTYLPRQEANGFQVQPPARIEVQEPRPFGELRALVGEVLGTPGSALTRARQRLARMGVQQVDGCLPVLDQYRVPAPDGEAGPAEDWNRARQVRRELIELQTCFRDVVAAAEQVAGAAALRALRERWRDGAWLPDTLQRRVLVNTDTPGVVHLRTTAAEGSVMRASPTAATVDLEVAVTESTVLDTARDTSLITMGLLGVVAALTLINRGGLTNLDAQTLAAVLVLFPAIQAGRIERPDRGSLRGLLAQSTYLLSLATVFPPVALAAALALREGGPDPRLLAAVALVVQALLHVVLRRRPPQRLPAQARPAALLLQTDQRPKLAQLDRIRGRSCRSMIAEALLLGREAHAYVARDGERQGALEQLLLTLDGERGSVVARRGDGGGLLGLMRSGVGGQALTFVVHSQQVRRTGVGGPWGAGRAAAPPQLLPVPFTSARLAPLESPAWVVEILLGLPHGVIRRLPLPLHPVTRLARACRASGFPILLVQHPSPPPAHGAPGLEWLRVRVSVPFVPGEDLSGLRRFYEVVDGLREARPGRPACVVHVYVTPELATYEAPETAADEASRSGGIGAGGVQAGTRPAEAADVIGDDPGPVLPLALCAGARVGLVGDLLDVVATQRPDVRLAGITIALLHGLTVSFLYCGATEPGPVDDDPADPDAAGPTAEPHPAIGLGALVRRELEGSDEVHVVVEATGRRPVTPHRPPDRNGPLLRVQLRTPDRAGVVPSTLERVASVVRAAGRGGPGPGLDVWFALLRVVDGRSLQGRIGIWLPGVSPDAERPDAERPDAERPDAERPDAGRPDAGRRRPVDWVDVDWSAVTEDEHRFLPQGRDSGPPLVEDDPVLTVNLARVSDQEPRPSAPRPSEWAPPTTGQTGRTRLRGRPVPPRPPDRGSRPDPDLREPDPV